jgi:hypothetical protein
MIVGTARSGRRSMLRFGGGRLADFSDFAVFSEFPKCGPKHNLWWSSAVLTPEYANSILDNLFGARIVAAMS